jgi:hypothetical protein
LVQKSTLKIAEQLLDRFFRDAEGRTNRQVDVYFALEDMAIPRDKAAPALEYLQSRGLLNLFGNDIGFLTDKGVAAMVEEQDLGALPKEVRDFVQKATPTSGPAPAAPAPTPAPRAGGRGSPRPKRAQLTHIDLEGKEFTLPLGWRCGIGRADDNEVRINDQRASKHHAEIVYEDGAYFLVDMESANGTLLNGEYALEKTRLKHDDEVVIGRTMLLYQCPAVVQEPPPLEPEEAPQDEPGTVLTHRPAPAPTERPAAAAPPSRDSGSIRVVKGRPDTPPAPLPVPQPAPRSAGPDLFAEPPTRAPARDLFAEAPPPARDLFEPGPKSGPVRAPVQPLDDDFDPPTQVPGGLFDEEAPPEEDGLFGDTQDASPADDDLFGEVAVSEGSDDLFADGDTPQRAQDGLFEADGAPVAEGLFDEDGPATAERLFDEDGPATAEGLFEDDGPAIQGGDDLFSESPIPEVLPAEPLDTRDTVAEPPLAARTPAPDVDDLWTGDVTPANGAPELLDNPPVQYVEALEEAPIRSGEDGATLMMDRSDLFEVPEAVAPEEEHPRWADSGPGRGSHPGFGGASLDAATEALDAEDLPVATPSLAVAAISADTARTVEASPNKEFTRVLAALREHLRGAHVPDRDALLLAVDLLENHPYIRTVLKTLP